MPVPIISAQSVVKTYGTVRALDGLDLTVDEGELTPSLKLRRKIVVERYGREIDLLYR